jgi:hypothetical protein
MTGEQLDFFTQQTERTATKAARIAVREYRNRAIVGFIILLFGIIYVQWYNSHTAKEAREAIVQSGRAVALLGCNRDYHTQQALRSVITASKAFAVTAEKNGVITEADLAARQDFYDAQLAKIEIPDCRAAKSVVTDDPRDLGPLPEPLYPGHPGEKSDQQPPVPKSNPNAAHPPEKPGG